MAKTGASTKGSSGTANKIVWMSYNKTPVSFVGTGYGGAGNYYSMQELLIPANTFQSGDIIRVWASTYSTNNVGSRANQLILSEGTPISSGATELRGILQGGTNLIAGFMADIFVGSSGAYYAPGWYYNTANQANPYGSAVAMVQYPATELLPAIPSNGTLDPTKNYYFQTYGTAAVGVVMWSTAIVVQILRV